MNAALRWGAWVALIAWLGACGEQEPPRERGQQGMEGMGGMSRMEGTGMKMPSLEMMPALRARADSLATMPPGQIMEMLPGHDSMVIRMMDAMEADMKAMNMPMDHGWMALRDSVRRDLSEFGRLSGEALILRMRAHAGRMRRLLEMHQRMMGSMGAP